MTVEQFEKEIKEKTITVVDFFAQWCGPCKALAPTLANVEKSMPDVKFMKIDIEENTEVSTEYGIRSVPTLLFFKNGELEDMSVGNVQNSVIVQKINALKD